VQTVHIKVVPNSSKSRVSVMADGTLKVNVTAPPEKGRANEEVSEILRQHFGAPVEIATGHGSPRKTIKILR
jgi:uncharacterized protein